KCLGQRKECHWLFPGLQIGYPQNRNPLPVLAAPSLRNRMEIRNHAAGTPAVMFLQQPVLIGCLRHDDFSIPDTAGDEPLLKRSPVQEIAPVPLQRADVILMRDMPDQTLS